MVARTIFFPPPYTSSHLPDLPLRKTPLVWTEDFYLAAAVEATILCLTPACRCLWIECVSKLKAMPHPNIALSAGRCLPGRFPPVRRCPVGI